ncbi:MAG: nitrate- and nitrite sensing domain-containing protein [Janthinobacterium lividum]|jgi:hypothetical protein|uniref:nitrate regulatory protein n=1 Tax=Pseudomonas sp. MWU16-30317 TaxID=2878095 RepID=UPI001CFB3303|nr:nitrate regulatory protein [Pseudomonas sp. MWU16-30317]
MPDRQMPPALRFMLAARRIELEGLEGLAVTCELVTRISELIHALQRERGYTNLYLAQLSDAHRVYLDHLSDDALEIERVVRERFDSMDLESNSATDRARLFNRIAHVLHGLDELPGLRRRIRDQMLEPGDATVAFTRMIGGLLAVVFEAADTAADPLITRVLVAMFNFMQGKELAGQERACGVGGFSQGFFDAPRRDRMEQLAHSQERCFETFLDFADDRAREMWFNTATSDVNAKQARMRAMALRTSEKDKVSPELSELWFDVCTERMDAFKGVENHISTLLHSSCHRGIQHARADLDNHRELLKRLGSLERRDEGEFSKLFNVHASDLGGNGHDTLGPHLSRSVLDLLQAQTQRLVTATEQLDEAREALNERRVVERAKKLLMEEYQVTESQAYVRLRKTAMERGERLVDVAQNLLNLAARRR